MWSAIFLDCGMSRMVHPHGSLKVGVEHGHKQSQVSILIVLNVHSNILRLIRDGGWGGEVGEWVPMSYHLLAALLPPPPE